MLHHPLISLFLLLFVTSLTDTGARPIRRLAQVSVSGIAANVSTASSLDCSAYINFAFAAYCSGTEIQSWTCTQYCTAEPGYVGALYEENDVLETAGYVAYNNNTNIIVVAFRGSYNAANAIEDLEADLGPYTVTSTGATYPGLVHQGFLQDYNSLQPQIETTLTSVRNTVCSNCQVVVVGHSLGAAMANLAAYDLAAQGKYGSIISYTYGSPRTGNGLFATEYNSQISTKYRNVHRFDPVPHVPPFSNTYPDDYWHVDTEIWQDASGLYRNCDEDNIGDSTGVHEVSYCSDALTAQILVATDHLTYCGVELDPPQCGGLPITV